VEGRVGWMTPLVSELQEFCERHAEGDRDAAAAGMLAHLRHDWDGVGLPDLPPLEEGSGREAEELALEIVRDVGEVAGILLEASDQDERLAWARANLISGVERYAVAVSAQAG
jgi:hypothetical protein